MSLEEEWLALGARLRAAGPEVMDEVLTRLRRVADAHEAAQRLVATGCPVAAAVLGPLPAAPRTRPVPQAPRSRDSH